MIIFLVSGFWHGASWNFIVWGFIHACCFLPLLLSNKHRQHSYEVVAANRALPSVKELSQMLTNFTLVTIAWVFFRANNLTIAWSYLKRAISSLVFHPKENLELTGEVAFVYILPLILIDWWLRRDERQLRVLSNNYLRKFSYFIMLAIIYIHFGKQPATFIYFQF